MSTINIEDFRLPNSDVLIDYERYYAAQVANGERCRQCQQYITTVGTGRERPCFACEDAVRFPQRSLDHEVYARCPDCGHLFKPDDFDRKQAWDGSVELCCPNCDHRFQVETAVSVSWISPPRMPDPADCTPKE